MTPGWREVLREKSVLPENTTQRPQPVHEPGPLNLESRALTIRPLFASPYSSQYKSIKARPNACNISTQHIPTLLCTACCNHWPPCCNMLDVVGSTFLEVAWCCTPLAMFAQHCCTGACALVQFAPSNILQHIATGWPNACQHLHNISQHNPTMLWYVALKCCVRLARALRLEILKSGIDSF